MPVYRLKLGTPAAAAAVPRRRRPERPLGQAHRQQSQAAAARRQSQLVAGGAERQALAAAVRLLPGSCPEAGGAVERTGARGPGAERGAASRFATALPLARISQSRTTRSEPSVNACRPVAASTRLMAPPRCVSACESPADLYYVIGARPAFDPPCTNSLGDKLQDASSWSRDCLRLKCHVRCTVPANSRADIRSTTLVYHHYCTYRLLHHY